MLNEAENLTQLSARLIAVADKLTWDVEFILVDDGSTDDSYRAALNLRGRDRRFLPIRLSRNFGSHGACLAGFSVATGDYAVVLSADLQDPPELIGRLLEEAEQGRDIVLGSREMRDDPFVTVAFSTLYNRMMKTIAMANWPAAGFDFLLVARRVYRLLVDRPERNTSIFGQILWMGFSQSSVPYTRAARASGRSKWTLAKKIKLAVDSFVSFSYLPVRLMSGMGMALSILGVAWAAVIIVRRILYADVIVGWPSLMSAVLVIGGIQMLMLGIIGEYLWRTLDEVRGRPPFIIAERAYGGSAQSELPGEHTPVEQ